MNLMAVYQTVHQQKQLKEDTIDQLLLTKYKSKEIGCLSAILAQELRGHLNKMKNR